MNDSAFNCWEIMQCGREPGGTRVDELGICPSATERAFDGVNQGYNAGRFCWAVTGTLCGGDVQGTFAEKALDCMQCMFYAQVVREEGRYLILNPSQLE